jgi:hypothetical protein
VLGVLPAEALQRVDAELCRAAAACAAATDDKAPNPRTLAHSERGR